MITSCTILSPQRSLVKEVDEPTPLEEVDVTIEKLGFLEAGWKCCEMLDYPKFVHPLIVQVFGCADMIYENRKVIKCHIVVWKHSQFTLEHELKHCQGYND